MAYCVKNQNLSLSFIKINKYHELDKSSLAEIMKRLDGIKIKHPKDQYQETMKKFFDTKKKQFIKFYENILQCETNEEYIVKYYNLLAPLPLNIINSGGIKTKIKKTNVLVKAAIYDMIQALKQRINYIIESKIPVMYEYNELYKKEYLKIKDDMKIFLQKLIKFEKDWEKTKKQANKFAN